MSNKINILDTEYLSFQGGGGKGFIYSGAIKALEKKIQNKIGSPIIPSSLELEPERRQIKGISGASAGAITAYLLSLGMSSKEIEIEMNSTAQMTLGPYQGKPIVKKVGRFEKFFDNGKFSKESRSIDDNGVGRIKHPNAISKITRSILILVVEGIRVLLNGNSLRYNKKDILMTKLFYTDKKEQTKIPIPSFFPLKFIYPSYKEKNAINHIENLITNRGLFNGFEVRTYFKEVTKKIIRKKYYNQVPYYKDSFKNRLLEVIEFPEKMTFKDHFNITGVNLVITGTNITQHSSKYFSIFHTPDFPVIEAVGLSMNLPMIFKPVYNESRVDKTKDHRYNNQYKGLWVDGGMLNNFPIHAFDRLEKMALVHLGEERIFHVAANTFNSEYDFNEKTLGFQLGHESNEDQSLNHKEYNKKLRETLFPKNKDVSLNILGDLFKTFMFPGSSGQIRNSKEEQKTIMLPDATFFRLSNFGYFFYEWGLTDFASPELTKERKDNKNPFEDSNKQALIDNAQKIVEDKLN